MCISNILLEMASTMSFPLPTDLSHEKYCNSDKNSIVNSHSVYRRIIREHYILRNACENYWQSGWQLATVM